MTFKEFHYRWEWDIAATPEEFWPYAADTNRFNLDAGLAPLVSNERLSKGFGRLLAFKQFGLVTISFEEEPFQWVYPHSFGVVRRYTQGPILEMTVKVQLQAIPTGTHLIYEFWMTPRNIIGYFAIPIQAGVISHRNFSRAFRLYEQLIVEQKPLTAVPVAVRLEPQATTRLEAARAQLVNQGVAPTLVEQLLTFLTGADDFMSSAIRPYALADQWQADRRDVLEMFLLATRVGILDFQWELLCPLCRGSGTNVVDHLQDLHNKVHCESCNINYTANFDRSVEITFRPNSAIRHVEKLEYCVAGPMITPHIIAQQIIPAGEQAELILGLELGRYRLRSSALDGGQAVIVAEAGGQTGLTLTATAAGWPDDEKMVAKQATLTVHNNTAESQMFIFERMAWSDQAVTAAEVTTLQKFRDLFASEALRPGEQFAVGSVAILFTDLINSTRMYNEIGDAPAFGLVLNHFDILRQVVDEEEGAIVKTIGDAIMGVFRRPVSALRAITKAQMLLADAPDGERPLHIKAGIHYGPCIAVTLNERLDYFGSAVNLAARLEGFAGGNGVVITEQVRNDPEVAAFLAEMPAFTAETFTAHLKGFDQSDFELWRVKKTGE